MAQNTPRKGISEPSYAVHRPSIAGPSTSSETYHDSHHENENDDERPNTPPPYSSHSSPSLHTLPNPQNAQPQPNYPGLPSLPYHLYSPPTFTLSTDATTLTSSSPPLSTSPSALLSLIQSLATIPPKPVIRILGTSPSGIVDFDVKINMMNLIVPPENEGKGRGRMNYVKVIGRGEMGFRGEGKESVLPHVEGGLEEWVRLFCEDEGAIKHFILERAISNWDTSYLQGRLLSLIASTSYRGHVTITFPITHSKVLIRNPDKINKFISSVTKVFTGTRKYEVVKSVWPYADVERESGGGRRKCVVQDEESWFVNWRDCIKYAAVGGRKGWVTVEDRLEFLMEPRVGEKGATGTGTVAEWGSY